MSLIRNSDRVYQALAYKVDRACESPADRFVAAAALCRNVGNNWEDVLQDSYVQAWAANVSVSPEASLLLIACCDLTLEDSSPNLNDLAKYLGCHRAVLMGKKAALEELIAAGFMLGGFTSSDLDESPLDAQITVWQETIVALTAGTLSRKTLQEPTLLRLRTFLDKVLCQNEIADYSSIYVYIQQVAGLWPEMPVSKHLTYLLNSLVTEIPVIYAYLKFILNIDVVGASIHVSDLGYYLDDRSSCRRVIARLSDNNHFLYKKEFLKLVAGDFVGNNPQIELTHAALSYFYTPEEIDFIITKDSATSKDNLLVPDQIQPRKLHYNQALQSEVNGLFSALSEDKFIAIQERLTLRNLPTGLAILLSGPPGMGKTELVRQLARQTGRKLLTVDLAAIKDMWVGESEKNVMAIFTRYTKASRMPGPKPILLFNEADGLLGRRIDVARSVDQMHNTMQNILLEQMERFDGILVATTNLPDQLDPAFERRFLFKLHMTKPTPETSALIWQSHFPWLTQNQSLYLAESHPLNGGEIANIARKLEVCAVIDGVEPGFTALIMGL